MQKIGDIPNTRADNNGEFTDGNVAAGVPPTILPAEWFNTLQRELIKVVQEGGLTLDPNDDTQILAALNKLFLQSGNNLSEIKAAGPTAVAAALANLGLGDAAKRTIGTGSTNVPDISIGDTRYMKVDAPNTRLWVSNEYTPVNNTVTIVTHGVTGLDLLRCKCDVVLKRAIAGDGYAVGETALSASFTINAVAYHTLSVVPSISLTDIRLFTPAPASGISGIEFINRTTGELITNSAVSNWHYIFRVWY